MLDARQLPADDTHALHGQTHHATRGEVGAQVLQNFAGGCGVAIAIAALQSLAGVSVVEHWEYPAYLGALAWGVAMFVRSQIDEYKGWLNIHAIKAVHAENMRLMVRKCDRLETQRNQAWSELAAARTDLHNAENERDAEKIMRLRAAHERHSKGGPVLDMFPPGARQDARDLIALWYAAGTWPGYRTVGMTRERHIAARQLLERVGILRMGGRAGATPPTTPPETEAWAVAKLAAAFGNGAAHAPAAQRTLEVGDASDAPASGEGEDDWP
jgi:hypothetical protein